jgi:hypothetical protein
MPKRMVDLSDQRPLLNVVSHGRRGLGRRDHFTPAQYEQIARTVRRVPEVMIKVSGGARSLRGLAKHLDYIGREGELEIETDDGRRLQEKGFEKDLIQDWDLDLEAHREQAKWARDRGRKPPKLVHNLVFSMPKRTPPEKVYAAVRKFAGEKFALQHRYAMTLHTDGANPHVHVVVKAVSEQGQRLNIRKATLREWRRDFAQYLRELGVPANATERAVRGESRKPKKDGIYRATGRGASTHMREQIEAVAKEIIRGRVGPEPGRATLLSTRRQVEQGWRELSEAVDREGQHELASQIRAFVDRMPPASTEKEFLQAELLKRAHEHRDRDRSLTR